MSGKLTALAVERATGRCMLGDGGGLYLQVRPTGKSWIFRYTFGGKTRHFGLGPTAVTTLKMARERAIDLRRQIASGIDPLAIKQAERASAVVATAQAITFRTFAESFIVNNESAWRSQTHRDQWRKSLEVYAHPIIGSLPVSAIDTPLILKVLQPMWHRAPQTASRLRGRLERILAAAKVAGLRSGENPAAWRNHLAALLPKPHKVRAAVHHPALPYQEIPAFMVALRSRQGVGARAVELAILTACRRAEVVGIRWSEIDVAAKVWTIPAERMKAGKQHRVPLSDAAIAVLRQFEAIRSNDFVFPGNASGGRLSDSAPLKLLEIMGRDDLTLHGFRSTFRDWCAEQTSFPHEVCEAALAHSISNQVEAAYRRGDLFDKRARLMDAWAEYCESTPTSSSASVIPMRAR
jgi:integrase